MNVHTQKSTVQGPAGKIEMALDMPAEASKGVVVIAHPHPLFGGTLDNKVVQTLARAFTQCGWTAVRFNFRGVGDSAGTHDDGRGELEDMLAVVRHSAPTGRLALAGFSFGAFVTSNAFAVLHAERELDSLVHGEQDDTVPLIAALDWARPQILPVTVIPGVGHFFHGQLPLLKSLVVRHLGHGPI